MIHQLRSRLNAKDSLNNTLVFQEDSGEVILYSDKKRLLGKILMENSIPVYYKHEDESQIHRKSNGWSINATVLKAVKAVRYETKDAIYEITQGAAFKYGKRYKWDKNGIDSKLFVSLQYWEITHKDVRKDRRMKMLGNEWYRLLMGEFNEDYLKNLNKLIARKRKTEKIIPDKHNLFTAYSLAQPSNIRAVIITDYIDPEGEGLAISTMNPKGNECLDNMFEELDQDVYDGIVMVKSPDLTRWGKQGVFLLNRVLTSGENGLVGELEWERFTLRTIELLNGQKHNIVYMLWGEKTHKYENVIDSSRNMVLKAPHPSDKDFIGSRPFSQCNDYLSERGKGEIFW